MITGKQMDNIIRRREAAEGIPFGGKSHPVIGAVITGSSKDAMGLRTVLRQHEYGFSKTLFDITVIPYKVLRHQEWSAKEIPDVKI